MLADARSHTWSWKDPCRVKKTLVLGLGNILLSDEGVGVRVVERLQALYEFPEQVRILDGGTLGLDLLPYVGDADRLLVVDAVEMGAVPGTLVHLEGEKIPSVFGPKLSPHQVGFADLLDAARLTDSLPEERVLLGCQPASLKVGLELSPAVEAQVELLVERAITELLGWGIPAARRPTEEKPT
jgi:hydrogenase maturation protease